MAGDLFPSGRRYARNGRWLTQGRCGESAAHVPRRCHRDSHYAWLVWVLDDPSKHTRRGEKAPGKMVGDGGPGRPSRVGFAGHIAAPPLISSRRETRVCERTATLGRDLLAITDS